MLYLIAALLVGTALVSWAVHRDITRAVARRRLKRFLDLSFTPAPDLRPLIAAMEHAAAELAKVTEVMRRPPR